MLFLQLFYAFFKIGLFGFGGGYAMISMIQGEVVYRYYCYQSNDSGSYWNQFSHLRRLFCGSGCRLFARLGHLRFYHHHRSCSTTFIHSYGTYQPLLPQIPKTPSCSCSVQWITSRCSRLASSSSFGTDEQRKFWN